MTELGLRTPVLLVDDDEGVRRMLHAVLHAVMRGGDLEVTAVTTGTEALAHLTERPAGAVLLDLDLPDGRSTDLLRWLHENEERPPWLVISAMDRRDALRLDESIGKGLLAKPFDHWALVDSVRAMTQVAQDASSGGGW
ncbi:MAG: response regulator [Chloroflexota bacterium]